MSNTRLHDGDKIELSDIRMSMFGADTLEQVEIAYQKLGAFIQDKQFRVMNDPDAGYEAKVEAEAIENGRV